MAINKAGLWLKLVNNYKKKPRNFRGFNYLHCVVINSRCYKHQLSFQLSIELDGLRYDDAQAYALTPHF